MTKATFSSLNQMTILRWLAPIILFVVTLCTTVMSGIYLSGGTIEFSGTIWKGIPYALALLIVTGAHASGHYVGARLNGVKADLPFFIPTLGTIGTIGAFTKISWPISDRKKLISIFVAGPIAGFFVSWLVLAVGLLFSEIREHTMTSNPDKIRNSIIVYLTSLAVYGRLPETKDLFLHPIAYAGWLGLFYNSCHLLPIGKFDGGRLIYALWGFQVTRLVSFISIGLLFVRWICMAWRSNHRRNFYFRIQTTIFI
jgi:membrane-associated protease RseP (regulator of RpoE activity)